MTSRTFTCARELAHFLLQESRGDRLADRNNEWFALRRFLLESPRRFDRWLTCPVTITKRERPDFLIEDAAHTLGVEVVRALPERQAILQTRWRASSHRWRGSGANLVSDRPLRKAPPEGGVRVEEYLGGGGDGYLAAQEEELRAQIILDRINDKLIKSRSYDHAETNVLYVLAAHHDAGCDTDLMIGRVRDGLPTVLSHDARKWMHELLIDVGRTIRAFYSRDQSLLGD